ncbi:hypothetical protein DXG01_015764 [Tephrocybe rancida]|nr:hypothetical protein DXG01_015764 [Tephrocybe rancida]
MQLPRGYAQLSEHPLLHADLVKRGAADVDFVIDEDCSWGRKGARRDGRKRRVTGSPHPPPPSHISPLPSPHFHAFSPSSSSITSASPDPLLKKQTGRDPVTIQPI